MYACLCLRWQGRQTLQSGDSRAQTSWGNALILWVWVWGRDVTYTINSWYSTDLWFIKALPEIVQYLWLYVSDFEPFQDIVIRLLFKFAYLFCYAIKY